MVFFKNGTWYIAAESVTYSQHGETITQPVGVEGHDWWVDFAEKWDHTEIISFDPIEPTADQVERLGEINTLGIPDGHSSVVGDYVTDGAFPDNPHHILEIFELRKKQLATGDTVTELEEAIEIMQGGIK